MDEQSDRKNNGQESHHDVPYLLQPAAAATQRELIVIAIQAGQVLEVDFPQHSSVLPAPAGFTTSRGFPTTEVRLFCEMEHGVPQQPIRFGLMTTTVSFEPGDDVGIQTHSYGLLRGTIELAHFRLAPVENLGRTTSRIAPGPISSSRYPSFLIFTSEVPLPNSEGSSKTRMAVSNRTSCLRRFCRFFCSSRSNRIAGGNQESI